MFVRVAAMYVVSCMCIPHIHAGSILQQTVQVDIGGGEVQELYLPHITWHKLDWHSANKSDADFLFPEEDTSVDANTTTESSEAGSTLISDTSPEFIGFEPKTVIVDSLPRKTALISILGRHLNSTGPWKCRFSGNGVGAVAAVAVDDSRLICPVSLEQF